VVGKKPDVDMGDEVAAALGTPASDEISRDRTIAHTAIALARTRKTCHNHDHRAAGDLFVGAGPDVLFIALDFSPRIRNVPRTTESGAGS
jgi:hypothetical protein